MPNRLMTAKTHLVLFLALLLRLTAAAGAIDTLSSWTGASIHTFGDFAGQNPGGTTFGQTFIVREDNVMLTKLGFGVIGYAPHTAPEACTFEAVIMAWNGSRPTGPILYRSSAQTMPTGFFPQVVFALNLGGVTVARNQPYVVFFTSNNSLNGVRSDAAMYSVGNIYNDGSFVSHYGPSFNSLTSQNWEVLPAFADLAIRLDYAVVPEPATAMLLAGGILGWLVLRGDRLRAKARRG